MTLATVHSCQIDSDLWTFASPCRAVSRTRMEQDTEAEVELVFNETSTEPIPQGADVVNTLREAVSNPNSTFNLSVDPDSITFIRE